MHFIHTSALALATSASFVGAASLRFWTLDNVTRTVYCTPAANYAPIPSVIVSSAEQKVVNFPDGWQGMCYAVKEGYENKGFGMLVEIRFQAYQGKTYFDVSAIDDPEDTDNVKQMFPASGYSPFSGCESYETQCPYAYYQPSDVQTKATDDCDLVVTLGSGSTGLVMSP